MPLKKLFFLLLLLMVNIGRSQIPELSPLSKISVLTSGPGKILYTAFGHSAIRIQDSPQGIDVVYNYGVFDTSDENFYLKFSQGRMYYLLIRQHFKPYLQNYKNENRWVKEQQLNLTVEEKNKLFKFLEINNLPENKRYRYDYFLNNCATKIWDVLKENYGGQLVFEETYINDTFTFRELIHHYIHPNSWGAFGIDLALGSVIDRKATPKEHMYMPDYIVRQLNKAKLNGQPIAQREIYLFKSEPEKNTSAFFISPLFFTLLIAIVILALTFFDFKRKKRSRWLDFGIFLITGVAGLQIFFLWFLTDHIWTVGNYNVLWAFPLNIVLAFFALRKSYRAWVSKAILVLLCLLILMLIVWGFKMQVFSFVLIPLLIALAVRYYYLWSIRPKAEKLTV